MTSQSIHVRVRLFAMLRERAGSSSVELELPAGATAGDVWTALDLGPEPPGIAIAVNHGYTDRAALLADGDVLALIPPVSGGGPGPYVALTDDAIDLADLLGRVTDPGAGAVATFSGTVRDLSRDRDVDRLEYEIYPELALAELRRIATEVAARHDLLGIAVVHRGGRCEIGETTVAIACSAAHRDQALSACRETIDTLKASVPIWKKEYYTDGAQWIGQGS